MVHRIYVEKKKSFAVEADSLLSEIHSLLQVSSVKAVRLLNRYDVEGISEELFKKCIPTVFSEAQTDITYKELPKADVVFVVELHPGQFDQREESAADCIQLVSREERPLVQYARVYMLDGDVSEADLQKIKKHIINPVESREIPLDEKSTLVVNYPVPPAVEVLHGFNAYSEKELEIFLQNYALAMDMNDLLFTQNYFKDEGRDPTITEIRVLDTYWSDHCRHTTFNTIIENVQISDEKVQKAYERYLATRKEINRTKPETLMDIATIAARYFKAKGMLANLDESEEVNACCIKIKVDVDGAEEDWLLYFKNETHNHPTEIEPYGGSNTCVGGAIRDPLSGRSYVYQAMRVTGAGDPYTPLEDTLPGKLPQRKLVTTAAKGNSAYGNQIGLPAGLVDEIYHPGYVAKRMELGAVLAAAPAENVMRETPVPSDVVILLGVGTGRDGIGGATSSSKSHSTESVDICSSEVQRGNAPAERKMQRLFRNKAASTLIKRCNDFGAGGVSVAVGEMADGLHINLDTVPTKYDGLDGTELAISESQERMAIVVAAKDLDAFMALAKEENLQATVIATVTEDPRMKIYWRGDLIVDISREFLNSNGTQKYSSVNIPAEAPTVKTTETLTFADRLTTLMSDLNVCGKKGLIEHFGYTAGATNVLMPLGGKYQATPAQAMVSKVPILGQETKTCSGMAYGFNPYVSEHSTYNGGYLAVIESVSKLIATGIPHKGMYLSFQEFFEKLGNDPTKWGKPFSSLLGALDAQLDLELAAVGGKDSMSGSFEEIHVPPTLVSFAVGVGNTDDIISPEFKKAGSKVVLITPEYDESGLLPVAQSLRKVYDEVQKLIKERKAVSVYTPAFGGIAEAVVKMCFGNALGFAFDESVASDLLFAHKYGSFVVELADGVEAGALLGYTTEDYAITGFGETVSLQAVQDAYDEKLEDVFPFRTKTSGNTVKAFAYTETNRVAPTIKTAKPKVLIPVFPGTNGEYEMVRAFEKAGAETSVYVLNNLTPASIQESIAQFASEIKTSQILALSGGSTGGDEPDGAAKLILAVMRNALVKDAVHELLGQKDGLMLGIANGFQALVKLGLVPFGEIKDVADDTFPTLAYNTIGRFQGKLVSTRIASNKSPWLQLHNVGDVHTIAFGNAEGRFTASEELIATMAANGQIATQYIDLQGLPTIDLAYNPGGSVYAIEAITSPDGRILGKMAHSEHFGDNLYKNVPGDKYQKLFEGGVAYFK